jgi:hypothetical protein
MTHLAPTQTLYLNDTASESLTLSATANAGTSLTAGSLVLFAGTGTTVQDYAYASGQACEFNAVAPDTSGNIIGLADCSDSSGQDHWIVRRSTDGGTTWTNIDDFVYSNGNSFNMPFAFLEDGAGNLWVGGSVDPNDGTNQAWFVRELPAGKAAVAANWVNADFYEYPGGPCPAGEVPYCNTVSQIVSDSSNNVYVAGYASPSSADSYAVVRKLASGATATAANWVSLDNSISMNADGSTVGYGGEGSISAPYVETNGIAIDGTNLYYAASYLDNSGYYWWVTRWASTTAPTTWQTVDNFLYANTGAGSYPQGGIAVDSSHRIFEAGFGTSTLDGGKHHWLIRESTLTGSSASFSTVDDYTYGCTNGGGSTCDANAANNGGPSVASAIGINPTSGEVYVAGYEATPSVVTGSHAPLRVSTDHGTTWTLFDDWFYQYAYFTRAYWGAFAGSHFYWSGFGTDTSNYNHALIRKY